MTSAFWSNTIYYVILALAMVSQLIAAFKKEHNRQHLIVQFLIVSGITFAIEATICCFLKAYNYSPMLFVQSPMDDALAGNLFSQYCVTATAMLAIVYNLKYYWYFILAGVFSVVEVSFVSLGIYEHYWYQAWMTFLGFPILFLLAKKLYKSRLLYENRKAKYFLMLFALFSMHMPAVFWAMKISGFFTPNMELFNDKMNSYAFISILNLAFLSLSCMFIYFSQIRWWWKATAILALYGVLYFVSSPNARLFYVKEGWFLPFATFDIFGMFLCIYALDRLILAKGRIQSGS